MSSDESDVDIDTGTEVLYVRNLDWRKKGVIGPMDMIDKQRRMDKELFANKGSKPILRLRKSTNGNTRRNPPTEKPRNLFEKSYLEKHKNVRRLKLSDKRISWLNIDGRGAPGPSK
jgi:hypothetical protein